jgi:hypothetical protein
VTESNSQVPSKDALEEALVSAEGTGNWEFDFDLTYYL